MNSDDIKTRVFRTFGDEAGIQILPADVDRWINDAQREIATTAGLLETQATQTVNTQSVALPLNLLALHAVSLNGQPIEQVSFHEGQNLAGLSAESAVAPQSYWTFGRTIFLWPAPSGDTELTLFYTREPTAVSEINTVLDIPINYHTRIFEYCMKQAYELDENFEAMALKGAEFDKNMQTQQNQESWQSTKLYPFITPAFED
jgi:hypothetical protein